MLGAQTVRVTGADPADPRTRYTLQTAVIGARLLGWPGRGSEHLRQRARQGGAVLRCSPRKRRTHWATSPSATRRPALSACHHGGWRLPACPPAWRYEQTSGDRGQPFGPEAGGDERRPGPGGGTATAAPTRARPQASLKGHSPYVPRRVRQPCSRVTGSASRW
ncbi:hypothetical protein DRB96_07020 [Streptomyces sp. ICC1]|nr:hypothetical protein DRB89_07225 [Streptomyces sp. ICC4]AWZ12111.1 hypothetical protein DRB96_07020 [Streptomyces sp. ICC1]